MIERFRRADRWTLGSGDGLLFAPPHPQWLDRPGFWDGVLWYAHRFAPAFTLTLVGADGREIALRTADRMWTPAALHTTWTGAGFQLTENRVVLDGGRIVSDIALINGTGRAERVHLVAWTAIEAAALRDRDRCGFGDTGEARFRRTASHVALADRDIRFEAALHTSPPADLGWILEAQHTRGYTNTPDWSSAPFRDVWDSGPPRVRRLGRASGEGRTLLFIGLACRFELAPGAPATCAVTLAIAPVSPWLRQRTGSREPGQASATSGPIDPRIGTRAAAPRRRDGAGPGTSASVAPGEAVTRSDRAWTSWLESAPALASSDAHVARFFAYRWYDLRLQALAPAGRYQRETCAEGTDVFHAAIAYSAWCHALELRWVDITRAHGVVLTFLDRQRADGSLPGIIHPDGTHPDASYFADWGGSVLALDEVYPDAAFLHEVYAPLVRYANYLLNTRDPDRLGLYRVLDPYETGQEYMSRYTAVDAQADRWHFDNRLALLGIDLTVYTYRLRRALARIAATLGLDRDRRLHDRIADGIGDAVRSRMWDAETGMFSDIDPRTGRRTGVKAAVCFYPYLTDITGPEHLDGLERNLFDPASFWTPYPVPSTAADDPSFSADGWWQSVRRNCPWNGRVWPMTNSHVADALGTFADRHAPHLRARAAELVLRTVRMMFDDGDPARPNAYEHYSPITGGPSRYRGVNDYLHSWLNDLIIRWIVGFRPSAGGGFLVDPLPSDIAHVRLAGLPYRGERVLIEIAGDRLHVTAGARRTSGPRDRPLVVAST
ncbi:MAG: hypothetical protein L0271_21830 [Gemmatimonadetes bacterium]|nr:hypothetical protein [Gemmatimonadota bacterium]